jgi:galactokinase
VHAYEPASATRERVVRAFRDRFTASPAWLVRAPGRVNLIGEHTDYNEGFVLPMAIDREVWIALRPRDDGNVVAVSLDFDAEQRFALDGLRHAEGWIEYVLGTAWALQEAGLALHGWEGVLAGDVPQGAGLSSSAALEIAVALSFGAASGLPWDPVEAARRAQRGENAWVGVQCGIMDQLVVAAGIEDHALRIDCRDLARTPVPLPRGTVVAVLDTGTRRGLVDSAYNDRRQKCREGARRLGRPSLRDVALTDLPACLAELPGELKPIVRHVVTENARTLAAAAAFERHDATEAGRLMHESHRSLRDDFAVSSAALDSMVEIALESEGCHGARMTGAGFGGCAIALVAAEGAAHFVRQVERSYRSKTGIPAATYVCRPSRGASLETP